MAKVRIAGKIVFESVEAAVDTLLKIGGTLVGSRAVGLERWDSDWDIAFTDADAHAVAVRLLECSTFENIEKEKRLAECYRYALDLRTYEAPWEGKIDVFLTSKILPRHEQLQMSLKKVGPF